MDLDTQRRLLTRIDAHRAAGRATDVAEAAHRVPVSHYTDAARLEAERALLRRTPTPVGLSGLVPAARSYATVQVGDASVVVTRDDHGAVRAMLNVCRHRGAEVTAGCGHGARLTCPYHGWTYALDGSLVNRRRAEYFEDEPAAGLQLLPVLERHGIIWVSADPDGAIDPAPLHGAEAELAPFALETYRQFATTTFTRPMNWKLAVDTFCEAYHLSTLHRTTLAPMIHDDFALFDSFGPHGRMVATRKSIDDVPVGELAAVGGADPLLPHATILWFLVPNTVLIHQQDHVQLYQSRPGTSAAEAHLDVTLYVPADSPRSDEHWRRNFDLLVDVTDSEDFTTAAGIQRGLTTGAQPHLTFGRNEPALQHYHRALAGLLNG